MITQTQARLIAHALHEIRPKWSIDGTMKVLERNSDHPATFGEILAAATTAALDPDTQTPGRIFQVTTHWPTTAKLRLPKPPACEDHPEQDAPTCRCCHADIKTGMRPPEALGKHHAPPLFYPPLATLLGRQPIDETEAKAS